MAEWNKIKAEYIRGNTSCHKLADKYGVSYSSIRRRSEKEKWTELRAKSAQKSSEKIVDSAAKHSANVADTLYKTTEILLRRIAEAMAEAPGLTPTDAANWANALERVKRTAGIKDKPDADEQQARIEKLRKETQTGNEESAEGRVVVIPARVIVEEQDG